MQQARSDRDARHLCRALRFGLAVALSGCSGDFTVAGDGSVPDSPLSDETLAASSSCEDALGTTSVFVPFEGEGANLFAAFGSGEVEDGALTFEPDEGTPLREGRALLIGRDAFAELTTCANVVESGASGDLSLSAKRSDEGFSCLLERESGRVTLVGVDEGVLAQDRLPWSLPAPMRILATHEGTRVRCAWLHTESGEVFALEGGGQDLDGLLFELRLSGDSVRLEDLALGRR